MVDNDKYIHVQRSDTGIDYTIYDAGSAKVLDGGVLDGTEQQLSTAALEVCKLHNIGEAAPIRLAPLELLKDLREANELPLDAAEHDHRRSRCSHRCGRYHAPGAGTGRPDA